MTSWVETANAPECHFPVANLPYGVASWANRPPVCVSIIGDRVVDLTTLAASGLLPVDATVFATCALNDFMAQGPAMWAQVRARLRALFAADGDDALRNNTPLSNVALIPVGEVQMHLPFRVSEYTDFYAGRQHAFNVGSMFRGAQNALPPNWLHIPIGYNGRASTVVVSDTPVRRPLGQTLPPGSEVPVFGPSKRLDIELELGAVVGTGSVMGEPITTAAAKEMIFGYVLLNDWSARDIQAWEYQPLGPFQAKAFATTISPWVVTASALEPFACALPPREKPLLPYLEMDDEKDGEAGLDIALEVHFRERGSEQFTRLSHTNARHLYYSAAQQLTHHAIGGCRMRTGDLLGSGTISGETSAEYGSLLELTWGGRDPLALPSGNSRTFLEDGDSVRLTGWAQAPDYRIGFGDCVGEIVPAPAF
jgi:fumarylacetoacetase